MDAIFILPQSQECKTDLSLMQEIICEVNNLQTVVQFSIHPVKVSYYMITIESANIERPPYFEGLSTVKVQLLMRIPTSKQY